MTNRLNWNDVLAHAGPLARGRTKRQLFYTLVADGTIPNSTSSYNRLCRLTARAQRAGAFPNCIDETRTIHQERQHDDLEDAVYEAIDYFRLDRSEGQDVQLWVGAEKRGINRQLSEWFDDLNPPIIPLGGWSSQEYVQRVKRKMVFDGRPAVLVYAGDFDPSGWFIPEDFAKRVGLFTRVHRIGVTPELIDTLSLVENPAPSQSKRDPRATKFVHLFGSVRQVEVDAIPTPDLENLYSDIVEQYTDYTLVDNVLTREEEMRAEMIARLTTNEGG